MPELRILRLVGRHLPRAGLAALLSALAELSGIALIATAAWLLATAAHQPPLPTLSIAIVAVRTFAMARGTLRYLDRLVGHDAVLRALAGLRATIFERLAPLAPLGSRVFGGGDLLSRMVSDVDAVQDLVLRVVTPMWTSAVVCFAAIGFTAVFSPTAAAVLTVGLLLAGVAVPAACGSLAGRSARRRVAARGALASSTVDLIEGARDLAAYGGTASARSRALAHAERLAAAERRGSGIAAATTASSAVIAGVSVIGIALAGRGLGVMTAVLALTALVTFESLAPLPAAARLLVDVRASAARLAELLDAEPPVRDPRDPWQPRDNDLGLRLRSAAPLIPGREPAAGVDLDLPHGRRIAIVGASGAGKSMLLAMLVRLCGIGNGTVELGGIGLESLRGDDVRRVIGGMMSDAHVFHGTVRENLLIGDPTADDAALRDALRRAGLAELEPSTMVGTDGDRLSGGQRQRLLLARALLADFPILLLDEPTEHLDADTAGAIMTDILAATTDRSLILVTHRLAGLDALDEILVLDSGEVIQRGKPADLTEVPGPYRDLHAADAFASAAAGSPAS